jgi:outer membrane protein assembly factor BamB
VFYMSAAEGKPLAAPFQPPLAVGTTVTWRAPAVIDDEQFVVTDGAKKIYLVEFRGGDVPTLEATGEAEVGESPLVTPLAIAGKLVVAGTQDGKCATFRADNLEPQPAIELGSVLVWGPYSAGEIAIAATADGRLVGLGGNGQTVWERPFDKGRIVGPPSIDAGECLLATDTGNILSLSLSDGSDLSGIKLDEPVAGGLARVAGSLVVAGRDGTLLLVDGAAEMGGQR